MQVIAVIVPESKTTTNCEKLLNDTALMVYSVNYDKLDIMTSHVRMVSVTKVYGPLDIV